MGRGLALPGPGVQRPNVTVVASPINDTQTIGLMACLIPEGSGEERVSLASEILLAAFLNSAKLGRRLEIARQQLEREEQEYLAGKEVLNGEKAKPQEQASGVLIASN